MKLFRKLYNLFFLLQNKCPKCHKRFIRYVGEWDNIEICDCGTNKLRYK